MRAAKRRHQSGQVGVETAIILPLMIFFLLGVVQLTMMQQARLMVEYAAFNACRSGIVWNMDPQRMQNAAIISLLPTFGATDTLAGAQDEELGWRPGLLQTWAKFQAANSIGDLVGGGSSLDMVRVDILEPTRERFRGKEEIDFDDFHARVGSSSDGQNPSIDRENRRLRDATRLTIRVRYLYRMRIPFANWIIHMAWLANEAGVELAGPIDRPEKQERILPGLMLGDRSQAYEDRSQLLVALWGLHQAGWYFIPMYATHSMRMQSNPFVRNAP